MDFKKVSDKLYSKLEEKEINGKLIYFKSRQVYPILNKDGSFNWFNFLTGGRWSYIIILIICILIVLGLIWEYHINLQLGIDCLNKLNNTINLSP
jgi:hypothetical protein